ncbi:hypothetical protein H6F44_13905 [Pseudanabaena sp. FACHB-1277]|uniref:Uncharacterized protein n=1 Tax=Pseudanabaena cinerea FACHB-1277 TaxID=2949581 RepID=A0A926Z6J1_9CYAN|nr:hypothetical protein [Pseudanabaena cinerea]MBD2151206.1 hypothetical protein [Pseudanabaena cinerea FACHB-1277]
MLKQSPLNKLTTPNSDRFKYPYSHHTSDRPLNKPTTTSSDRLTVEITRKII